MTKRRSQPGLSEGFSLLEILLVVAMLGVIVGLSIPSLRPQVESRSLESAARTARQYFRYAQYLALAENLPYSVVPDPEKNCYRLVSLADEQEEKDHKEKTSENVRQIELQDDHQR